MKTKVREWLAVLGIALGISTAGSEVIFIPFVLVGIGLLALSEVTEW